MSKQKKKKDNLSKSMKELMIRQYLKESSRLQERAFDSSPFMVLGQTHQNEQPGSIEDAIVEQSHANYVMDKVMENITPYLAAQWQGMQHDKKKKKRMDKRICRLETQIACLELELEQLCQALAYFLAIANVSMPNISASDIEKEFKALYKKHKKAYKHSSNKLNEIPLLPGNIG